MGTEWKIFYGDVKIYHHQNAVIMRGKNNMQHSSVEDIVDGIVEIVKAHIPSNCYTCLRSPPL